MVTFHLDQGKEIPWLSQFKIEIEKPLNRPRFKGREALWLPSIQIKVEKPLGRHMSQTEIEKPLSHPIFQDSFQNYQFSSR